MHRVRELSFQYKGGSSCSPLETKSVFSHPTKCFCTEELAGARVHLTLGNLTGLVSLQDSSLSLFLAIKISLPPQNRLLRTFLWVSSLLQCLETMLLFVGTRRPCDSALWKNGDKPRKMETESFICYLRVMTTWLLLIWKAAVATIQMYTKAAVPVLHEYFDLHG